MEKIRHKFALDFQQMGATRRVFANQNENGTRCVDVALYSGGKKWKAPADATVAIAYRKPDNTQGCYDHLPDGSPAWEFVDTDRSEVEVALIPHMLSVAGPVHCKLKISSQDHTQTVATFRFDVIVDADVIDEEKEIEYYFGVKNYADFYREVTKKLTMASVENDKLNLRLNSVDDRLSTLSRNPAMITDVTAAFEAVYDEEEDEPMPLDYLVELPDGQYYMELPWTKYFARLVTVDGCRTADVTEYLDDGSTSEYRFVNGELALQMETWLSDDPMYLSTYTFQKRFKEIDDLKGRVATLERHTEISTWEDVQSIVRAGYAPYYFRAGDQFECQRDGDTLVWTVLGFDKDKPADPKYTHSMTLQLDKAYMAQEFSPRQAFFYLPQGLPVGTYYFYLPDSPFYYQDEDKYYHFTVTTPIPAGAQMVLNKEYTVTIVGTTISIYDDPYTTTAIGSVTVGLGQEGTELASVIGEENINRYDRAQAGNNNYLESALRQFLNSENEANEVWEPQTIFDRPPRYAANHDGFLYGMDEDFLNVIGPVSKTITMNKVDVPFEDRFFVLSRDEAYGSYSTYAYEFYRKFSTLSGPGTSADANRSRKYHGINTAWWLRNPYASDGRSVGGVTATGTITYLSCSTNYAVVPACCIV